VLCFVAFFCSSLTARADVEWTFEPAHLIPEWPDRKAVGLAFDFNRGEFESDERSDTLSLQPALRLESDNVMLRASLPFYRLEGPIEAGIDPPRETEWGVGDLTLDLAYTVYPIVRGGPFFDLLTRFKIPTADDLFGTGKFDVSFVASLYQPLGLGFAAIGDLGVRLRGGDLYRDTLLGAFILGKQFENGPGVWLAYDWRESPLPEVRRDEHELTPFLSFPVGGSSSIEPYGLIGLSPGSPDWGVGCSMWWRF